ncbi:Late embryogenesis abundant (LEA) hydroxyproline-rich glycoprotein family [Quillaja saponaria]|uniref:Late embryogenesis abundant (LEA) hydroxyproline-rich glycoprotein family n=1 Tax=Quillaja saponaria TaxID=32244 RepID=A0AAD7KXV8_QUISA|nr:Late embryogenesis abundant (LEA) hydroxyproline-rich glycoprotein family [Quillaja saponaria]
MGKMVKWSWSWSWNSALIGAASVFAATTIISAKPKEPTFHLISIKLTSFKLNLPVLDADLIFTVHVTNPNTTPVHYSPTTMSIYYEDSLLGAADVQGGFQPARFCQLLRLQARLHGLELAHYAARFAADLAKREMVLDAAVDIVGTAKVLLWDHKFKVHVDNRVTVDPMSLDIFDQESRSKLDIFIA